MHIDEAYKNLCLGNKISHINFINGEYLYLDENCIIRDESGYDAEDWYTFNKDNDTYQYGWNIYSYDDRDRS